MRGIHGLPAITLLIGMAFASTADTPEPVGNADAALVTVTTRDQNGRKLREVTGAAVGKGRVVVPRTSLVGTAEAQVRTRAGATLAVLGTADDREGGISLLSFSQAGAPTALRTSPAYPLYGERLFSR